MDFCRDISQSSAAQSKITVSMKPFVALSFILASACAKPQLAHTVAEVAATAPAPFTTVAEAESVTTVHQPAPVVTKQVHLGETSFVSGYATRILKPATPHLPISVPTVLKGSVAYNAPIVKEQIEVHQVQNPVLVERRVEVPYDVPVYQENIVKVPTPVHVDAPYNVHVPTPVAGEPIIKRTQAAPVVTHSQHVVDGGVLPAVHAGHVAHPAVGAYAAAPAAALLH